MKKKKQKTNAIRLIEQKKIAYQEYELPWSEDHIDAVSVADILGKEAGKIFKTLVAVGNKTGVLVAVIPGNKELNLKSLAKASGNKKVEMLPMKELEATTGYIRGGCSPVGMKKLFPTFIGSESEDFDTIIVSAGQRGLQMELTPTDLISLTRATVATITE